MPVWIHILSILSLIVALACAFVIALDLKRNPQHMWIMNLVWPLVALFGSVAALWAYFRYGRLATAEAHHEAMQQDRNPPSQTETPFAVMVGKGAAHCGSGCALGDLIAEWLAFFVPAVAVWFGWQTIFAEKMFAVWVLDYIFAFSLGVVFQYFTIKPMRGLSVGQGILQAIKADFLSLTAWQIGMYGFMAFAQFFLFRHLLGIRLEVATVEFWFMMQIAMWAGFATACPVNWWLLSSGIKEKM
ncbi:DUF4396 domain-containing protein [Martelella mediterranea]|uniref:DUF4396 domain-containing protein n=1 Tax=Martelella mediterranea DSM 17316 TaxID=1122214 RepID=A0A1U9Z7R4_9HYPH|nr:DUF4396 domain-containing protein [Martelella mediterranea]AQZ53735.1 hypothetical protein Mame_04443 [Martelella mediterranea DSM 17316]